MKKISRDSLLKGLLKGLLVVIAVGSVAMASGCTSGGGGSRGGGSRGGGDPSDPHDRSGD